MSEEIFDVAIIGAGVAGASLAAYLPSDLKVALIEGEETAGYHSTGRSAAIFSTIYGNGAIRALTRASEAFFTAPPQGFAASPLVSPRGVLFIARAEQRDAMAAFAAAPDVAEATRRLSIDGAMEVCPQLRRDTIVEALHEPGARDLDVHALHNGFLRAARRSGHRFFNDAMVTGLHRDADQWIVDTPAGRLRATIVVNAAGAWAASVARLARAAHLDITPRRRTMVLAETGGAGLAHDCPLVVDVEEQFYFKPESGGVLISPADETATIPSDVQPEELDVAIAIDRFERATTLPIRRVRSSWAGLRNFAPDRTPVVGFDREAEGFFWLAGQGGFGIQTAPALGRLAAALVQRAPTPRDIVDQGLDPGQLSPKRAFASLESVA